VGNERNEEGETRGRREKDAGKARGRRQGCGENFMLILFNFVLNFSKNIAPVE